MVADLAGIERKAAKAINLGLAYGMGEAKLCHSLGLPTEWQINERTGKTFETAGPEGKELLERYHMNTPFLKGLTDFAKNRAATAGQIRTIGGRLCRFAYWESKNGGKEVYLDKAEAIEKLGDVRRAFTHKALNRLIQGSAADQTKEAMYQCWQAGYLPLLQVHDELCFSVETQAEVQEIKDIMENCIQLKVPSVVDAEVGPTWYDAKTDYREWQWSK